MNAPLVYSIQITEQAAAFNTKPSKSHKLLQTKGLQSYKPSKFAKTGDGLWASLKHSNVRGHSITT